MILTFGNAMLLALGACILGAIAYVLTARLDKRAREIDQFERQLDYAASNAGLIDAWARIKNEIARPANTPQHKFADRLSNTNLFRDQRNKYIVLPIGFFAKMPVIWQARFIVLLTDAKASLPKMPWPRYYVTVQDANPPHQFVKEDPLIR